MGEFSCHLSGKVCFFSLKFTFSEKATTIDKIFTVNLTVCCNPQIDGEDFFVAFLENMNFKGRKNGFMDYRSDVKFIFSEKATKFYKISTNSLISST